MLAWSERGIRAMSESFGEVLRRYRIAASLTQEALAQRCRLSPATIAAIEQGRRNAPRLSTVRMIAEALGLPPADRAELARAASDGAAVVRPVDWAPPPAAGGSARPRAALPAPITPLFGRHAEVDAVTHELAAERLVTLTGPGGVGKTRLALEVASASGDKFAGGTFWADLGPVSAPERAPEAVLRALGGSEQPAVAIRDQVAAALPGEPALLVLDNCEHVLGAAAALIGELLAHPPLTILATSREPLAIPGEIRWQVPPLAVPPAGPPASQESLSGIDSVQLFVERASRANPAFTVTDAEAGAIAQICRRLDGIPLAIELAAARMGALRAGELAGELDERIPLATPAARGVPQRHTTLQACIDWSYRLLTSQDRAAFRCLAAFTGPFTAPAFAAITGTDPAAPAECLYRLADKSLVSVETHPDRYRVLDTVRAFAVQEAGEAAELAAIHDAHADYYASWLAGLNAAEADDAVLDLIDTDYANVRTALTWSIETGSARAAAIVAAMGNAWQERAHFHDALVLGDAALRTAAGRDPALWAKAVAALANARLLGGDMDFLGAIARAHAIAKDLGDHRTQGWCELALGTRPPFDGALLASAYKLGAGGSSPTLATLAAIFLAYGGTEEHREQLLRRASELSDGLGNATLSAACQVAWADSLVEQGRLTEALDLAVPAAFDPEVMPTVRLLGIGRTLQVAFYRSDPGLGALAATMSHELAKIWPAGGPWLTSSWTVFGNLLQMWSGLLRGERPPAPDLRTLGRATRMALTPSAVRTICQAALDRGDRLDPADVAMATSPPTPGSLMAASLAAVRAAHAMLDDDPATARRCWSEVLSAAAPEQYLLLICDALEGLGCLAAQQGDTTRASMFLAAAGQCRHDITYQHRFRFEQALLDQAWPGGRSAASREPALPWHEAVAIALE